MYWMLKKNFCADDWNWFDEALEMTRETFSTNYQTYESEKTDAGLVIRMNLPGVKKQDLTIDADDLSYQLHLAWKRCGKDRTYKYTISDEYDVAQCAAKLEDGVLEMMIPQRSSPKNNRTRVKIE